MKYGVIALAVAGTLGVGSTAHGYSTKLHLITGKDLYDRLKRNCRIKLGNWNSGKLAAASNYRGANKNARKTYTAVISPVVCRAIKKNPQIFIAATTAPDTFIGMFGNTDPSHALLWNTAWQTQLLWKNAKTDKERAFVAGWLVHFAGDLNAHGLANLHAGGIWMTGKDPLRSVWGHILTETYYAHFWLKYPKHFNNTLVWPEAFVKKMFYNPNSPLYRHSDYFLSKSPQELGAVAKAFGYAYRAMFLLWDWHGREYHKWRGRKDYYRGRRNNSVSDYFHWLFADQAMNLHLKKMKAMAGVIDRWYRATARAQQAIVADGDAKFTGKKMYDYKYKSWTGKARVDKKKYKSGGLGGLMDAYKWLGAAIADYLAPNVITITNENSPGLRKILDGVKKFGRAAQTVMDAIRKVLSKLKDILLWPLKKVGELVKKLVDPVIAKAKNWLMTKGICGRLPQMCRSIDGQMKAFGVQPGKVATYMRWPIYRNTITAGALALAGLGKTPRRGDETVNPIFGLPSGDFGCTAACTRMRTGKQAWLFMPMAGMYYSNATIKAAFPDYCTAGQEARRAASLNEGYSGRNNNQANQLDNKAFDAKVPGYTCFGKAGGSVKVPPKRRLRKPTRRPRRGSLGRRAALDQRACRSWRSRLKRLKRRVTRRRTTRRRSPRRRTTRRRTTRRRTTRRPVLRRPARAGAPKLTLASAVGCSAAKDAYAPQGAVRFKGGPLGGFLKNIYDHVVGTGNRVWDFRLHPAPRSSTVVRSMDQDLQGNLKNPPSLCYRALRYYGAVCGDRNDKTCAIAGRIPDPNARNRSYYKKTSYSLREMVGGLFAPITDFLRQKVTQIATWAKNKFKQGVKAVKDAANKACKWISGAVSYVKKGVCDIRCKASAFGMYCSKKTFLGRVKYPCWSKSRYNSCRERKCKKTGPRRCSCGVGKCR